MQITSWNINGIRSAYSKQQAWFTENTADIVCLQEIKAQDKQIPFSANDLSKPYLYFNCARQPGYAGVAVLSKIKPLNVERELGHPRFDMEGRLLRLDYPEFTLLNLYLPHGGRQKENLPYKLEVYRVLLKYLQSLKGPVILAGDFNIARSDLDLARPKQNFDNIMFTEAERACLDQLIQLGYLDTFRLLHPEDKAYTWWPYLAEARTNNIGWRIDYIFLSQSLSNNLGQADTHPNQFGSDHCPISVSLA